jgi:hypothetical protein
VLWYKKRTIFGNLICQKKLYAFRSDLVTYFSNLEHDYASEIVENSTAKQIRSKINRSLSEAHDILAGSEISMNLTYTPPAMIGGYIQNIDLVANVFNLHRYMIEPNNLLDLVDRAIGVYESDQKLALVRTFNPLFWFVRLLDALVSIPFLFFQKAGLSTKKFEESFLTIIIILYS